MNYFSKALIVTLFSVLTGNFAYAMHNEKQTESEEEPQCSICLESIDNGSEVEALKCCHVFHKECIATWLEINNTCPICRNDPEANMENQRYEIQEIPTHTHSNYLPNISYSGSSGYYINTSNNQRGFPFNSRVILWNMPMEYTRWHNLQ